MFNMARTTRNIGAKIGRAMVHGARTVGKYFSPGKSDRKTKASSQQTGLLGQIAEHDADINAAMFTSEYSSDTELKQAATKLMKTAGHLANGSDWNMRAEDSMLVGGAQLVVICVTVIAAVVLCILAPEIVIGVVAAAIGIITGLAIIAVGAYILYEFIAKPMLKQNNDAEQSSGIGRRPGVSP
jgi:hypothetical protein